MLFLQYFSNLIIYATLVSSKKFRVPRTRNLMVLTTRIPIVPKTRIPMVPKTKIPIVPPISSVHPDVGNKNRALGKPARQSSTYYNPKLSNGVSFTAKASLAVDGNTSPIHEDRSCMHAQPYRSYGWWEVDLEHKFWIEHINIISRVDFRKRLHDLRIDVYLERTEPRKKRHCTTYVGPPASPGWVNITCDTPVSGRYVRIYKHYKSGIDVLNMCEVEIYGASAQEDSEVWMTKQHTGITDSPEIMDQSYRNCCAICN